MRLLLLAGLLFVVAAAARGDTEEDFAAAYDAFNAGDAAQLERIASHIDSPLLEPYLTYYRLRIDLDQADPAAVRKFIDRPDDTPVIDRMRAAWLEHLGENQQWDEFDAIYPKLLHNDTELSCYALQSLRRSDEQRALQEVRKFWFNGSGQPDSCGELFEAALDAKVIDEQELWQRLRLTLEAGNVSLAKQLAARLPEKAAPSPAALSRAYRDPERYLIRAKLKHASRGQRVVALFALQRLARQLPSLAYRRWRHIARYFPKDEQRYFYGWLGYEGARAHDPHALSWYQRAGDETLTRRQLAWRARAAMRAHNWRELLASIRAMPQEQYHHPAWRYWKARALRSLGHKSAATALFKALSREYSYYGQLAGEEIGGKPGAAIMSADYRPTEADIASIEALPGIRRAEALYRMDLRRDGYREWSWALRGFGDRQLLAAAEVARRHHIYDRAIGTAERTRQLHDFNLRYLAPYRAELEPHIRETGLDEAWVYGLMRQESRFVTQAKSGVGAAGLMQIMPATARWVARKMGWRDYRQSLLHELDTNLRLGTYYMKTVLSRFDNNPVLASAAYNAGPTRARRWCGDKPLEGAIYIETIPFNETRDYVRKVMSNTMYYAKLFGQPPASLKQRLGVIVPDDSTKQAASGR